MLDPRLCIWEGRSHVGRARLPPHTQRSGTGPSSFSSKCQWHLPYVVHRWMWAFTEWGMAERIGYPPSQGKSFEMLKQQQQVWKLLTLV